jgi:hypothetical protein
MTGTDRCRTMSYKTKHHATRWIVGAALLAVAGCAAYPAEPTAVAGYCDNPAWCVGPYPDYGFGIYDYTGVYPYDHHWWHHDDGFHHFGGVHPGFDHHFAMQDGFHPGFGGFHHGFAGVHHGFGGMHGGFAHVGMAGHAGGGFHHG